MVVTPGIITAAKSWGLARNWTIFVPNWSRRHELKFEKSSNERVSERTNETNRKIERKFNFFSNIFRTFFVGRRLSKHLIDAPNGRIIIQIKPEHLMDAPNGRIDQMKSENKLWQIHAANRRAAVAKKKCGPPARNFFRGAYVFPAHPAPPRGQQPA